MKLSKEMNNAVIKVITFFFLFSLSSRIAFAFITTSTLAIATTAVGSFLWGFVVVVAVNTAFFFRRIKKKTKLIIRFASVVFLIFLIVVAFQRYAYFKKINSVYDNVPLIQYELDLNSISMEELSEYVLIGISTSVTGLTKTKALTLEDITLVFHNFTEFKQKYKLNKEKKILIICENGDMSSRIVQVLRDNGYEAFSARLTRTHNEEFLQEYFNFRNEEPTSSLVIVPYRKEKKIVFINFDFVHFHSSLLNEIESVELVDYINQQDFKIELVGDKELVCLSNFHCLLTKYLLDSHNITNRRIYKIPIQPDNYVVGRAKELILNET